MPVGPPTQSVLDDTHIIVPGQHVDPLAQAAPHIVQFWSRPTHMPLQQRWSMVHFTPPQVDEHEPCTQLSPNAQATQLLPQWLGSFATSKQP